MKKGDLFMKKTIILSIFASTLLVAQSIELQKLEVISSAIKTDELKSTAAVEIYTSDDIQKAHAQNIYEFLNNQTTLITMPSYGNPFSHQLDMRGFGISDGYQNIVVTIDGRRINNVDMTPQLLSVISPSSIERIEILKSSGIVEGGDGANAGIINIITKKDSTKEISFYGGTYGTADSSFIIGHKEDKLSLNVSGEAQKNDGIRHVQSDGSKDENHFTTLNFNASYSVNDVLDLRARVLSVREDVIYGGTMTQAEYKQNPTQQGSSLWGASVANRQKYDVDSIGGGFSYFLGNNLSLDIDANTEAKKSNFITYSSIADYTYNSLKSSLSYEVDKLKIVGGVDMFDGKRDSDATSYSIQNSTTKENLAAFLTAHYSIDKHSIKAGIRAENVEYKYSDATQNLNKSNSMIGGEVGYNFVIDNKSSMFVSYAHSYQSPDIDRFFNKDWFGAVSFNGFIEPSKADSITLGYNIITNTNKLKVAVFYIDMSNEIYYYSDPSYINSKNTNIDKSHKYGLDIYDKYLVSNDLNLMLNYNFVEAKIDEEKQNGENYSGNDMPGVSNHNIKATLNYEIAPYTTLAFTQVYRSKTYAQEDFTNSFSQKQSAYKSSDLTLSYARANYEFFAKINNLFNQKNGYWIREDALYPINYTTTAIAGLKIKI